MRVMVADDAGLFREGVARLLTEAGCTVLAAVATGDELLAALAADPPDLAIIDVRMPPTFTDEGLQTGLRIRAEHPRVGVLILSQHVIVSAALELLTDSGGGVGYVLKERVADPGELVATARRVAAGESVIDGTVADRLLARRAGLAPLSDLTERELEVLRMMARGDSNQAIAERLVVSLRTVESHCGSILTKLLIPTTADDNRRVKAVLTYLRALGADAGGEAGAICVT